ncbi:MAG: DUF4394 domain-containing protein [Anaerolineae bacterium]|nr:DUF4394 domain-containing protein [Anaerolineae bacterium]
MYRLNTYPLSEFLRRIAVCIVMLGLMAGSPRQASAQISGETIYALTVSNRLVQFDSADACSLNFRAKVTGLQKGEKLLGIDFRPATGQLYGLGSSSRLYVIDPSTAAATVVGTGPFTTTLVGASFGFDFNPTVDRIRVVSNTGQNLRLHPDTGAVAAVDSTLAYSTTDVYAGANPLIVGAAYTNPDNDPATGTTLYDIDARRDSLAIQNPPNAGTLNTVGALGVDTERLVGFDISSSGVAYAALLPDDDDDQRDDDCGSSHLVSIDLATGSATYLGTIGREEIRGLAVPMP